MLADAADFARLADFAPQVCVIGAGPVGIITALDLARRGRRVLLLESGGREPTPAAQALSRAENLDPSAHHAPEITVSRQLGGTSNLWGGRCLPFDPVDFAPRPWLGALPSWPIGPADLEPWAAAACRWLAAGDAVFHEALAGVAADPAFGFEGLERWSNRPRIQRLHAAELAESDRLLVALGTTVTGFETDADGRIAALRAHIEGRGAGRIAAPVHILAAGGNESTRLLLAAQAEAPERFGGRDGPLGRAYMGHVNGTIADIVFTNEALHAGLDYHVDGHGSYVRRRLVPAPGTQEAAALTNVAFWPVVPGIANPAHRSGPLSALFLGLSFAPLGRRVTAEPIRLKHVGEPPYHRSAHLRNVILDAPRTLGFLPAFLWKNRVAKLRLPGFFLRNPARRYGLEYHAEQLPAPESRLTLSETRDRLGMPRLAIRLVFSEADAAAVLRAHDALGAWLERNALGRLEHRHAPEARIAAVLAEAKHGNHQVGTIPMGADRRHAIVDRDCRAFDAPNLYVVTTAVLPTSGQANPTMTAVQLGLRLAERLAREG